MQAQLIRDNSPETEHYRFTQADPAMWIRANDSGRTLADIYADEGVIMQPGSNDRINGWQVVHEFLRDDAEGVPMLQVFDTCHELIRNIPALVHDEHRVEDVNTDGPDDEADTLRYGLMAAQRVQMRALTSSQMSIHGSVNLPRRKRADQWWAA